MSGETTITVVGNLVADPELRFTPSGAAVTNFTVASTPGDVDPVHPWVRFPRIFDKASGEFKDQDELFLRCNIWREAAENVAESLTRGMRVIVTGRLHVLDFPGYGLSDEKRTVMEVEVDEIGPSLRYSTARVVKREKGGGGAKPAAADTGSFGVWPLPPPQFPRDPGQPPAPSPF